MNTTHTPGPWTVDGGYIMGGTPTNGEGLKTYALYVADCRISSAYRIHEEQQANARLIAAAPDLLAALQGCIKVMQCADELSSNARFWIEEATATINKAKGISA